MNTVKEKLARGLNAFTRPQVVSLIIVTAVFLILFKESIQTATIILGFCSVADPDIANHVERAEDVEKHGNVGSARPRQEDGRRS